jgi:LmbE family N-acetylglucosaminyl deacetylase
MGAKTDVNVAIADEHLDDVSSVVARLAAAGMEVHEALPTIGAVTGTIDRDRLDALRKVEGVTAVEPSREVGVPPPESEIQ